MYEVGKYFLFKCTFVNMKFQNFTAGCEEFAEYIKRQAPSYNYAAYTVIFWCSN